MADFKNKRLNPDSNGGDDATGATDIHQRDGSDDSAMSHNNKACMVGIRGRRKC